MRFLVLNGPNLNLLGVREPDIYGRTTLTELEQALGEYARSLGVEVEFRQSNHEGVLIDWLHEARNTFQGVLINPGGLCHYSVSLLDAMASAQVPVVEVHLSNIASRDDFRRTSLTARAAAGSVVGFGVGSYRLGLAGLVELVKNRERQVSADAD